MKDRKVAVVTGGSRGIGKAIVDEFLRHKYIIYDVSRHCQEQERKNVCCMHADLQNAKEGIQCLQEIYKENGRIDILVNNAGMMENGVLGMISHDSVVNQFQVNVFAVIEITQLAARIMKKQKSGSIINVASVVGVRGGKGQSVYAATKGAVISFTRSVAKELAGYGIRVNAVAPGVIDTALLDSLPSSRLEDFKADIGLQRLGAPSEVARLVDFLASEHASYITGEVISVDGCGKF